MSNEAPADAQGELQGGIASLQSIGMLLGTVFFTQIFGYFMQPGAVVQTPNMAFFVSAVLIALSLGLLLRHGRQALQS